MSKAEWDGIYPGDSVMIGTRTGHTFSGTYVLYNGDCVIIREAGDGCMTTIRRSAIDWKRTAPEVEEGS